jgi:hypothetical protein
MKNTPKIMSATCLCAILASISGCSNISNSDDSVATTAPIYVQEDEYQYGNNTSETSDIGAPDNNAEEPSDTSSSLSTTSGANAEENKPHIVSDNENTAFDLPADKAYNTSLKPNITDDVIFEVELIYTENFETDNPQVVATEVLPLTASTTYADICNLKNFNLVTVDGDMSYELDKNGRFDYYGIMHTTANSPATYTLGTDTYSVAPTINLELIGKGNQVITEANSLVSTNDDIHVKAISAKTVSYNVNTEDQECSTPVMLSFNVSLPEEEPTSYKIGADWMMTLSNLKNQNIIPADFKAEDFYMGNNRDYLVLKNSDYTLVFVKEGSVVGSISLIKN